MTIEADRFGSRLTQTHLNRLRDDVSRNQSRRRQTRTTQGSFDYPEAQLIPFPYGDDRVSFWVSQTSKNTITCAGGNVFIGTGVYTMAATTLTLTGSPCFVYLEIPIRGGTPVLKKQASMPHHTSSYYNVPLRKYDTGATVYVEEAIYHCFDLHLVAPVLSAS
jgi:hypothetical protein